MRCESYESYHYGYWCYLNCFVSCLHVCLSKKQAKNHLKHPRNPGYCGSGAGEYEFNGVFKNPYNAGTKKKNVEMNIVSFPIFVGNGKVDEGVLEISLLGIDMETKAYILSIAKISSR